MLNNGTLLIGACLLIMVGNFAVNDLYCRIRKLREINRMIKKYESKGYIPAILVNHTRVSSTLKMLKIETGETLNLDIIV